MDTLHSAAPGLAGRNPGPLHEVAMPHFKVFPLGLLTLAAIAGAALAASQDAPAPTPAAPTPGTLAYDKGVWMHLLEHHASIRRDVRHLENGVEAVTESDDPAIAALIQDHALAMQNRMRVGARVRVWDPVFLELFDNADKVRLEIMTTGKGVKIVETSDDPHVVMLLRSHAAGLSDFVREGFEASAKPTPFWHERTTWTRLEEDAHSPEQQAQRNRALAARDAMAQALFARLDAELRAAGPASAIAVCKEEAPRIAAQTAEAHGVRIGRTSDRLRNPANLAPEWATPLLTDRPDQPRFAEGSDGSLGVVLPIRLAPNCLACHGGESDIAPATRDALAAAFPDDHATGFAIGDVRGWFWVETPAPDATAPQPSTP